MKNLFPFLLTLCLPFFIHAQTTPKVLLLGIDGVRPDALEFANTPNINSLIEDGIFSPDALNDDVTISGTGWSGILCGVWSPKHLVVSNDFSTNNYEEFPPVTKYLNEAGLHTVSIVHWNPINDEIVEEHADFKLNVDSDVEVADQAANYLAVNNPDFLFLHFDDVDHAGHASGFGTNVPEYIAAIEGVDIYVGMVLQALEARPTFAEEDWLILVTTDHGGINFGHGGNTLEEQNIFVIASGNTIEPAVILKDSTVIIDNPENCLGDNAELIFDEGSVQIASNSLFNFGEMQDFTVECRVRTNQAADVAIVGNKDWNSGVNKGFVFSFRFASGPEWKVNIGDGTNRVDIETGGEIANNEWTTLSVSFDRDGMMKMYENGVFVDEADISSIGDIDTNAGLVFGADINGEFDYSGAIAEVRVWNTVVDEQVIGDYSCMEIDVAHPDVANLIGYWKMKEGDGTTVEDFSGSGNAGTIVGATWSTSDSIVIYDYANTPKIVDVPVTALTHLCIPIEEDWALDGTSLIEECIIDEVVNIDFLNKEIQIFPNPVNEQVSIVFDNIDMKKGANLTIFRVDGTSMLERVIFSNQIKLDVSSFSKGVYMVVLESGGEVIFGKMVKEGF